MISYLRSLYAIFISFILLQSCNHVVHQMDRNTSTTQTEVADQSTEAPTTEAPTECCVCFEPIKESTCVIALGACNHIIHHACIVNTMIGQYDINKQIYAEREALYTLEQAQSASTCPMCRRPINNPIIIDTFRDRLLLLPAVQEGNVTAVSHLLTNVDPNAVRVGDLNNTLLHVVKDPRIAQLLIDAGAKLNAPNTIYHRPLHIAAHENNIALMEVLIKAGADLESQIDWLWTPLYFAVQSGHIEAMEVLIKAGANLKAQANVGFNMKDGGITPLHLAVLFSQVEALELLIRSEAEPDKLEAKAIFGCTPLAMAVLVSNKHFRALFLDMEARFNEAACQACIAALKKAGAKEDQTNALGLSLEALEKKEVFPSEVINRL